MKARNAYDDNTKGTTPFRCDLVVESQKHIHFLQTLHATGTTLSPVSATSIKRYVDLWLPMVAKVVGPTSVGLSLIPPPDVAWLWHCHRLAPLDYERYVTDRFGKMLEPMPPFAVQVEGINCGGYDDQDGIRTRNTWSSLYSNEPFFLLVKERPNPMANSPLVGGFDLAGSSERQATFLWQVSDPHFADPTFLVDAEENYHRFLGLVSKGRPLVPTYQIDLMWHTHMLASLTDYHADCIAIRGAKFHHDDSMNDRTPGASLDIAFQVTKALWKSAYGRDYVVKHGMYRGEPPPCFFQPSWDAKTAVSVHASPAAMVAGSFSSGKRIGQQKWIHPQKTYGRRIPAFIKANPRSRGTNANEKKHDYVFGKGVQGDGFYSVYTKDAYEILIKRLKKKGADTQQKINDFDCNNCLCWGCTPSSREIEAKVKLEEELRELENMMAYAQARLEADSPVGEIPKELLEKYGCKPSKENKTSNGDEFLYTHYTPMDVCIAGGCGGGGW